MAENKIIGLVIDVDETGTHRIECEGKAYELVLSTRVSQFYKNGLKVGKLYHLTYDDITNQVVYARLSESAESSKAEPEKKAKPKKKEVVKDETKSIFENLSPIECKLEKKGQFNYVSWVDAWEQVKRIYPTANFFVHTNEQGFPAFIDQTMGGFVKVTITINELTHSEFYPITNNLHKAIPAEQIKSHDVNNSIKRCLVKCLAYFGLGLYVYAGEDLPNE